jgi:YVTN family beta-propeller protein
VVNSLDGTVSRIDPGTNTVVQKITVGAGPSGIVDAAGSVWVANTGDGTITRIDPDSGRPTTLPVAATELAFGAGTLWASERAAGEVVRIDPTTGKQVFAPIRIGNGPTGIAFGHGAAWVANSLDGTVFRIDPDTNSVTAAVSTGNGPDAVAVDSRGIWMSNQFDGKVVRIDPGRTHVAQRVSVGSRPSGLAMSGDDVLVAVRHSGAGHRGGALVLRADRPKEGDVVDKIDSALSNATYTWPLLRMTGDGLTAFNQAGGPAGAELVPDLATSLPTPTDGGRTYTFQLRSGIRYSTGSPVQATDFRSTFERDFALGSPVSYNDEIVGGAQCRKHPRRCDLSRGIVADDVAHTVIFHLIRPDPDFLYKLALPFACVLPAGTPPRPAGTHPLPATGPYMIATYRPRRLLRFVRNPFFHEWSRAAQPDGYPDRIDLRIAGNADEAIRDVVDGKADVVWLAEPLTVSQASRLEVRYASQMHSDPLPNVQAFFLNTRVPPFNRLEARKAINFAVDRAAATNAWGGPSVAQPTCQILPPNFPDYRPYCPYTPARRSAEPGRHPT